MLLAALAALLAAAQAQPERQADPLASIRFLAGSWTGTGQGEPGASSVERRCEFILGGRFLHCAGKSTYAPQEKNPKGEVHEEWSIFGFDRGRKRLVMRQFHAEGFVNQYTAAPGATALIFDSEAIENIAPGWRARETYRVLNANEFTETFELAAPGQDYEVYVENRFKRKR